ncbi:unnamed protein product [Cochlearia groenlandica]
MEMKKIACGVILAVASMTTVMATEVGAPAPGPAASGASLAVPALGSLVGVSLVGDDGGEDNKAAPPHLRQLTRWREFVKDAQDSINWMITNIFIFIPAKAILPSDKLSDMFLPTIILYAALILVAKVFTTR